MHILKKYLIVILAGFCLSAACYASESTDLSSKTTKNIEGVYKYQFLNSFVSGEKYQSEDIVEIVSYSPDSIYFRIELQFGNGHSCGIYGIAKYTKDSFIYKSPHGQSPESSCTLKISTGDKKLKISDINEENTASTCSYYCGARGSLANYEIGMERKRKIKYMPIILKSSQYNEAVEEYKRNNEAK